MPRLADWMQLRPLARTSDEAKTRQMGSHYLDGQFPQVQSCVLGLDQRAYGVASSGASELTPSEDER